MKQLIFSLAIFIALPAFAGQVEKPMEIGSEVKMKDVELKDVSGAVVTLDMVSGEKGLLVLFSANTCPFVLAWEDRYTEIKEWADKNGVGMIVLNSNYKNRDGVDSYEAMKKHARENGYNFYYAVDRESKIANAFGAQTTPHAFLFDKNRELVYRGAMDDNYKSATGVKKAYLKDAIKSLGAGEKIAVAETRPLGCSIKRKLD